MCGLKNVLVLYMSQDIFSMLLHVEVAGVYFAQCECNPESRTIHPVFDAYHVS